MGTKGQFNSSTLKASYVAANDTAQVVAWDDCEHCAETPYQIQITFSGIDICGCRSAEETWGYWDGDSGVNDTFILTHSDADACLWTVSEADSEKRIKYCSYAGANCTGDETCNHKGITIQVGKTGANEITIEYFENESGFSRTIFGAIVAPDSGCLTVSSLANGTVDCWENPNVVGRQTIGINGTATIVEL